MPIRTYVSDFSLKNPFYAGATCAIYEVNENLQKTATLATLYAAPTGPTLRANPMVLDSEGKFPNLPIYAEKPVIIEVTPVASASVDLGVQGLVSRWRGVWASGTLYYPGERVRDPAGPTTYVVLNGHVSATFLTDVASGLLEKDIDGNSIAAAAAASLFGTVLPNTPVEAYYRVNPAGTAVETRTPTQVRADIGAFAAAGGNITGNVDLTGAGYLRVPTGLTAQRPGSPLAGMLRYNSDLSALEGYLAGAWDEIRGKGYVDAAVATRGALPQSAAGVGQWINITGATGAAVAVPAGGTWAWALTQWNMSTSPSGTLANNSAGVSAGGSTIGSAIANIQHRGFAWRVA